MEQDIGCISAECPVIQHGPTWFEIFNPDKGEQKIKLKVRVVGNILHDACHSEVIFIVDVESFSQRIF